MRRIFSRVSLLQLLFTLVALGVGVALGAWLFRPVTPFQLRAEASDITIPLTEQTITDTRTIELTVTLEDVSPVLSSRSGIVTALLGQPGPLESGDTIMEVNGEPIVALSTTSVLWRPLTSGDVGEDVVSLQNELIRLGYAVDVDGEIGTQTLRAVAWMLGLPESKINDYKTISPTSFMWLPAVSVNVEKYLVGPSSQLQPGQEILTLTDSVTSAHIVELPQPLVPGARVLQIDGETVSLENDGITLTADSLPVLTRTNSFASWKATADPTANIRAQYALAEPATVYAVPPAAIFGLEKESSCLLGDEQTRRVTVLSSELGQSLVTFDDGVQAPTAVRIPSEKGITCK